MTLHKSLRDKAANMQISYVCFNLNRLPLMRGTLLCCLLLLCTGCGGGSEPVEEAAQQSQANPDDQPQNGNQNNNTTNSNDTQTGNNQNTGQLVSARVDASGQKWIDNIPVDVWFGDPLKVAGNQQVVVTIPDKTTTTDNKTPSKPSTDSVPKSGGNSDWKLLISAEALESEVKQIRNRLSDKLRTVGSYNSGYLELPPHLATLTVLAAVAIEHPGEIRWKKNAKYIRDLSAGMNKEKMMRGAKSFRAIQAPFESIVTIFNGSKPATLEQSEDATNFSEVADFGYMMKRLEIGSNWLKVNAGSEENFNKNIQQIKSEAGVAAIIGKVISMEGYDYEDDDEFLGYAKKLIDGAKQMNAAANSGDFASYDAGLNMVYQSCTECHGVYR